MRPTSLYRRSLVAVSFSLVLSACAEVPSDQGHTPPVEEGFVQTSDGVRLFYRKVGDGPQPVILPADLYLHPAFDRLAAGRTLYYYDMRNRGMSDSVTAEQANSIDQDVLDLEAIRSHFGLESVDLVGYSYLGLMVAMYAKEHPEHVRRIVQLGPVPVRFATEYPEGLAAADFYAAIDSTQLAELRRLQSEGLPYSDPEEYCRREHAVTNFALVGNPINVARLNDDICDMPNEWPSHLVGHFQSHFTSVQELQLTTEDFADLDIPVLTIHGTLDRNAPYGAGREWALTLPDARLITVEGAAHNSWADAPELILGSIDTFLNGEWPAEAEDVASLVPEAS